MSDDCEQSFVPRSFPPPALKDVPIEFIIDQLHDLGDHYWDNEATSDCTIVVPIPHPLDNTSQSALPEGLPLNPPTPTYDPSGLGRRVTEPIINIVPRISLKLHSDYLCAHSSFLRSLFGGASPIDLINTKANTPITTPGGKFTIPADRLPRLLPSTPQHPTLFLPVPDPVSFHLLVHWMYFGETNHIEDSLDKGIIQWEGIARNVEYLGMNMDIKIFLGRWYGARYPNADLGFLGVSEADHDQDMEDDSDDSETSYSYEEDNLFHEEVGTSCSDLDMDVDELRLDECDLDVDEKDYGDNRGRPREVKCLSWSGSDQPSIFPQHDHRNSLQLQIPP